MNNRVNAFTIVEVLIAMLLSGIAIAFASTAYLIVSNNFNHSNSEYKQNNEFLIIKNFLSTDIDNACKIVAEETKLDIIERDTILITYDFYPKFITRSKMQTIDTFFITTRNFIVKENDERMLQDLSFNVIFGDTIWSTLEFHKEYNY